MIIVHAKGNSQLGIGNLSRSYELIKYLSVTKDIIGIFECDENIFKRYDIDNIYRVDNLNESLELIAKYTSFIYISDLVSPQKELSSILKVNGAKKILHFNEVTSGFEPDILFVTDSFNYEFFDNRFEVYRGFEYYIVGNEVIKNRKKKLENIESIKNILIC